MKNTFKTLVSASIALLALTPFAAADLEKYLPASETIALLKIENTNELKENAKKNDFLSVVNEKIFNPFVAALKANPHLEDKFTDARLNLAKIFPGEVVFGITANLIGAAIENSNAPDGFVMIADCPKDFDADALKKELTAGKKFSPISVHDIPCISIDADGDFYSVYKNKLIFATDKTTFSAVLSLMKDEKAEGVNTSLNFKKARARIGDADFWFYVDGATLAKKIYAFAAAEDEKNAKEMAEGGNAMFTLQATPFVKSFAPEAIDSIWGKYAFDNENRLVSETSLMWNEDKGIVTLLTKSMKDGIEKTSLLPSAQNLSSVKYANVSVGSTVLQLRELLRQATPLFAIVDMQLESLKTTKKIDVLALLSSVGNGVSVYSTMSESGENLLFVQNVSNEKLVADAIIKIAEEGGIEIVEDPQTQLTYSLKIEGENEPIKLMFAEGKLFVGNDEMINLIKARLKLKNREGAVWSDKNLVAGEALLPPGGCAIDYSHIKGSLASSLELVRTRFDRELNSDARVLLEKLHNTVVNEKDFDYSMISKTYLDKNECSVKSVIIKNK